jgi:hypothetical protein
MLVSEPIAKLVYGPWDTAEWALRCGFLRGDLDKFLQGERLTVAQRPYHGKSSYMLRLEPELEEVWEIRCRDKPGIRLFGHFADKDFFVGLIWEFRDDLKEPHEIIERKRPLEPDDFPDLWRAARIQCRTEWNNLFRPNEPHHGPQLHDYLSNAIFV